MSHQEAQSFTSAPLTDNGGHSERCGNPFCQNAMKARTGKKFRGDRCRMDGYVLRRAKEMIDRVGIVKFNSILETFGGEREQKGKSNFCGWSF